MLNHLTTPMRWRKAVVSWIKTKVEPAATEKAMYWFSRMKPSAGATQIQYPNTRGEGIVIASNLQMIVL